MVKRESQDGILEAWERSPRPMSLRKVSVFGTKGVGGGIGRSRRVWCDAQRVQMYGVVLVVAGLRNKAMRRVESIVRTAVEEGMDGNSFGL
jgi:hypothetical protein